MHPTAEMYESLQMAFDHFNRRLFGNQLPKVILTVQRKKGVMGYFAPDRWGNLGGEQCHEISINPSYIANCRLIEVMQTLVHEMVHCWQHCFGNPGRNYYHNREWAVKMIEIGLMPSSTGEPGGAVTGQQMGDYIIEGGLFLRSFNELKDSQQFQLAWIDRKALPRLFEPLIAAAEAIAPECSGDSTSDTAEVAIDQAAVRTVSPARVRTHYLSPVERSYSEMLPETFFIEEGPQRKTRYRYICYGCYSKVYGKPHLNIRCEDCNRVFECEEF